MSAKLVALPDEWMAQELADVDGVDLVVWRPGDSAPDRPIDLLVLGYFADRAKLAQLAGIEVRHAQGQALGYDGIADALPAGIPFSNAVGVHEGPTAELAVGLILAAQRGLDAFARAQPTGTWLRERFPGLERSRVLLVGAGGVNEQVRRRLEPFDVRIVRLARTNRDDEHGRILAIEDHLYSELPEADIVVIGLPLTDTTRHLVDDRFLTAMTPGSLLVNVSRGPIVDTDALLTHTGSGRLRAALDVTDPEPLPADHPLWSSPGVIISPHVGGNTGGMGRRSMRMLRGQLERLVAGEPLANVVIPG